MKKKILILVATLGIVGLNVGGVSAQGTLPQTDVTGVVTEKGMPVGTANVKVVCEGTIKTDISDSHGSYLAVFSAAECPFGSTVRVTANDDGKSGSASGTVHGVTTKLNIAIVNVSIPEFGMLAGLGAGGLGIGAVVFARRRQSRQMV